MSSTMFSSLCHLAQSKELDNNDLPLLVEKKQAPDPIVGQTLTERTVKYTHEVTTRRDQRITSNNH